MFQLTTKIPMVGLKWIAFSPKQHKPIIFQLTKNEERWRNAKRTTSDKWMYFMYEFLATVLFYQKDRSNISLCLFRLTYCFIVREKSDRVFVPRVSGGYLSAVCTFLSGLRSRENQLDDENRLPAHCLTFGHFFQHCSP